MSRPLEERRAEALTGTGRQRATSGFRLRRTMEHDGLVAPSFEYGGGEVEIESRPTMRSPGNLSAGSEWSETTDVCVMVDEKGSGTD